VKGRPPYRSLQVKIKLQLERIFSDCLAIVHFKIIRDLGMEQDIIYKVQFVLRLFNNVEVV